MKLSHLRQMAGYGLPYSPARGKGRQLPKEDAVKIGTHNGAQHMICACVCVCAQRPAPSHGVAPFVLDDHGLS